MKHHPTPICWMGKTVEQEHILRHLDRENPYGEILYIRNVGPRDLIVADSCCTEHYLVCLPNGKVIERIGEAP